MRHRFPALRRSPRPHGRRAFTLVELVVVVGIIVALLSLVLAVSTLLIQQNEARQLETAFAALDSAIQEYEIAAGRPVMYQARREVPFTGAYDVPNNPQFGVAGVPGYLLDGGQPHYNLGVSCSCDSGAGNSGWEKHIVALLRVLLGTESAQDAVTSIDPSLLQPVRQPNGQALPGNASLSIIIDPWGTPIALVMPGRVWRASDANGDSADGEFPVRDADGTIRTSMEERAGICRNGRPLFVSAGPDGELGCLNCDGGAGYEATLDNIYSYDPERPR